MKILILVNDDISLNNFRREIIVELLENHHEVYVAMMYNDLKKEFEQMGCKLFYTYIDRRGINPFVDLNLLYNYYKIINSVKPDCIFTYTIKPNIYGSMVASILNVPYINNITGIGSGFLKGVLVKWIIVMMYKVALKNSYCVFFQNKSNQELFKKLGIKGKKEVLIPGSGVNIEKHNYECYPPDEKIKILFISRIMKEKGIEEYIYAAREIKRKYKNVEFHIVGFCEDGYLKRIEELHEKQVIIYHGFQKNVHEFMKDSHCIVLPSYNEGMANVLLEAAATGRPVLASQISGCKETFDEGISGVGFKMQDKEDLIRALEKFLELPYERKKQMGKSGRKKMENVFDRKIVVNAYMKQLKQLACEHVNL